jgi:hypothetical protein
MLPPNLHYLTIKNNGDLKNMSMKKSNKTPLFLVLNEETRPIIEKIHKLLDELTNPNIPEETLENVQKHIRRVLL